MVKLRRQKLKTCYALVTYENGISTITLPPDNDDDYDLRTFLHELCHLSFSAELNIWSETLQELILERVLEPQIMKFIFDYPSKHRWWLKRLKDLDDGTQ